MRTIAGEPMPRPVPLSLAQYEKLQAVTKRRAKHFETKKEHALALGITQQSLSNLIKGTYRPGLKVADGIAELEGVTLEHLVGEFHRPAPAPGKVSTKTGDRFPGLTACIVYHAPKKTWPDWVIGAARGGYFGPADTSPHEWLERLDQLEATLLKVRGLAK